VRSSRAAGSCLLPNPPTQSGATFKGDLEKLLKNATIFDEIACRIMFHHMRYEVTPRRYAVDGKQYVIAAAGGHGSVGAKIGD
jgi:glucose dehydrogenase